MVRFTVSIYRNQKRSEHVLNCVQYLTHETATGSGKHHYDDSEIKGEFDFRAQLVERKKCPCATGRSFLNETDSIRSLTLRACDYSPSYRAKIQSPIKTIVRNLISSVCEIHYRDHSNAFNAYQLLHLCRRWKNWFRSGKGLLEGIELGPMYPHLIEDSEIFFEVSSWAVLFEMRRTTSHHLE